MLEDTKILKEKLMGYRFMLGLFFGASGCEIETPASEEDAREARSPCAEFQCPIHDD